MPVYFMAEDPSEEVPEFDLAVETAADDCAIETVNHDASDVLSVLSLAGIVLMRAVH